MVSIYTNLGQNSFQTVESEQKSKDIVGKSWKAAKADVQTGELLTQGIRLSCCRRRWRDRRVLGVLVLQCCFVKVQLKSFQFNEPTGGGKTQLL